MTSTVWVISTVLQCILYASVQTKQLNNRTQQRIPVEVFCKNNPGVLCTMMYKFGGCCTSFKTGRLTLTLTDTGRGKTRHSIQHRRKGLKTAKKLDIQDKSETPCTLQSTGTKTTKPTNHEFVFCSEKKGLYQASKHGQLGRVKSIIRQGLEDINCRGKKKRTPVMAAVRRGQVKVFNFLVSHDCLLSGVDYHDNNILHLACKVGNIVIARRLVVDGKMLFDVESRGSNGRTPIMVAAKYGNREVFEFLMNGGSNMKIVDYDNNTILHVACHKDDVKMVKYILSLNIPGIDVDSRGYNGRTPIILAAEYGNRDVFKFLMNRGSNMKIVDYDNNTILHVAFVKKTM